MAVKNRYLNVSLGGARLVLCMWCHTNDGGPYYEGRRNDRRCTAVGGQFGVRGPRAAP